MSGAQVFDPGGYRFIPCVSQYSGGVAAGPGMRIERVRFAATLPLQAGFAFIAQWLADADRPLSALCACELRSPAPFSEQGFRAFNAIYIGTLANWGLLDGDVNRVARSNVCPVFEPPAEPGFHAFSYTVPDGAAAPSFVIAGSCESAEGPGDYRDRIVALRDVSAAGLQAKASWVLDEMERRLSALGFTWADTTASQVYTVHDIHALLASQIAARGAMPHGLTWHLNRPPVVDLEYEMDCRGVYVERVLKR